MKKKRKKKPIKQEILHPRRDIRLALFCGKGAAKVE